MLPDSVILKIENHVLYWKNSSYDITVEQAKIVSTEIRKMTKSSNVTGMVVDNRGIEGVWPPDVGPIWSELMGFLMTSIQKCVTIANPVVSMQINRLSRKAGTFDKIASFTTVKEALEFMGISHLNVLD